MARRWIFFDAVGTLFQVRGSVGSQYARAARLFGPAPDPETVEYAFRHYFPLAPPLAFPAAKRPIQELECDWWKQLVREVSDGTGIWVDFDRYFERVFGMFATAMCWDLYPETLAALKFLKQHRWAVGIISNFDTRLSPLLEDMGLRPWIDQVTHSSLAGSAKPDPKIFLQACAQAKTAPASSWHVGNSLTDDYQGARSAGMNAILVDRCNRHPDFQGPKVQRLSQIFPLLEQR
ncbi:MAG: HAD-IA family hydrolase [Acidobacteria bacterium]|nr:HAD-IA family hydrolase [Acidobacteriota bacterium]